MVDDKGVARKRAVTVGLRNGTPFEVVAGVRRRTNGCWSKATTT